MDKALEIILEIFKYLVPCIIVFGSTYYILKQQSDENVQRFKLELNRQHQSTLTPIKLQAYERLVLLLERISPQQLIQSNNNPDYSARMMKFAMLNSVQQEFNYNLSQQIYVSQQAWAFILVVKEKVNQMIIESFEELDETAMGTDLSRKMIDKLRIANEQPTQKAIDFLKAEVGIYFG